MEKRCEENYTQKSIGNGINFALLELLHFVFVTIISWIKHRIRLNWISLEMWWCVKQRIEQELRVQSHFNGLPYEIHVNFWKLKVKWLSCAEAKRMEMGIRNLNWRIKPKRVKRKEMKKKSKHTVKWNIQWSYSCVVLIRLCLKLSPTIFFLPIKSYSIWFVQTKIVLSKNVCPNSALPLCATFNFESLEAMQMQYNLCVCVFF